MSAIQTSTDSTPATLLFSENQTESTTENYSFSSILSAISQNISEEESSTQNASPLTFEELREEIANLKGGLLDDLLAWMEQRSARSSFQSLLTRQHAKSTPQMMDTLQAFGKVQQQAKAIASSYYNSTGSVFSRVSNVSAIERNQMLDVRIELSLAAYRGTTVESSILDSSTIQLTGESISVSAYLQFYDPLVLDLEGDGIDLCDLDEGIVFDLDGTGSKTNTAFVQDDDALLYLDEDGDGLCSNGQELFGNQNGAQNGFGELAHYDTNHDRLIDEQDAIYFDLQIFNDWNHDGINQENESSTLAQAGITSIDLSYTEIDETDEHGNLLTQASTFTRDDGTQGDVVDAWFLRKSGLI